MGLLSSVIAFRERFGDDELGHVNFVLEEVRDGILDVTRKFLVTGPEIYEGVLTFGRLEHLDRSRSYEE